jgi:hypothetical protein
MQCDYQWLGTRCTNAAEFQVYWGTEPAEFHACLWSHFCELHFLKYLREAPEGNEYKVKLVPSR